MKVAVVGVVGRTNAGKSTLVNAIIGEKVSIVSPVEQTTRNTVRAILSEERGQIVMLDTPGLHKAVGVLGRLLNKMARRSAAGTDITCVVFDASLEPQLEDIGWMERIVKEGEHQNVIFVLNKADKNPFYEKEYHNAFNEALQKFNTRNVEPHWIKAISLEPTGVKKVVDKFFELSQEGERLFDEDIITDYPRKLTIADVIREKYIKRLFQEIPHELGIVVKTINETPSKWDVCVDVLVNRDSQKPMAIGKGASVIKAVRIASERELKKIYDIKIALKLTVKVERDWMKNERLLAEMGYIGDLI
jgi:GTP-binding protein Era